MLDKAIFQQKIKEFINSFKPANIEKKESLETIAGEDSRCGFEPLQSEDNYGKFGEEKRGVNVGFTKKKPRKKDQ